MGRIWAWVREHIKPYIKVVDECPENPNETTETIRDKVSDLEKRTEVGIKVTWKF